MDVEEYRIKYKISQATVYNRIKNKPLETRKLLNKTIIRIFE